MIGAPESFRRRILRWYRQSRRALPWRVPLGAPRDARPDPYYVLVSEAMLQQTQVNTVIPYFRTFIEAYPSIADLAAAGEQDVLRRWQGLGYYSRARNLRAAARTVMQDFGGEVPRTAEQLRRLPGVGRYTAGAIASLAFDERAAILDGNVARVLCRIDRIESDPRQRATQEQLWARAEQLLPRRSAGDFNSSLMELGATICTPRNPRCDACPVRAHCAARAAGVQPHIPPPRRREPSPLLRRCTFAIERRGRWLIEQRPASGRWASLWQFLTIEPDEQAVSADWISRRLSLEVAPPRELGVVRHVLTHRRYEFAVYGCRAIGAEKINGTRQWVRLRDLRDYPMSRPHVRIAQMLSSSMSSDE
jgi:A/G-specific adenine glycosylase